MLIVEDELLLGLRCGGAGYDFDFNPGIDYLHNGVDA
jgi:hypothetical protein